MDTSEQYIKMCEKAVEIHSVGWKLDCRGELFAGPVSHKIFYGYKEEIETNYTWLPRQEDLQGMVLAHWNTSYTVRLLHEFMRWVDSSKMGYYENQSMEQLWIGFAQHELHKKTWSDGEWIAETTH